MQELTPISVAWDAWLKDQQERWTCECGASFSWYEEACVRCGSQLKSLSSAKYV